ncbi:MAG: nitrilase-related carbon-nitrogen hydrolase [Anaerolineae bacterium]
MNIERKNYRFIWLALATALSLFVGGRWSIPVAAWIAPIFFIRFYRDSDRGVRGYLAIWLGLSAAAAISWHQTTALREMGPFAEPLMFTAISLLTAVPYVIDRIFYRRWAQDGKQPFWLTLIYPISFTAIDYIATAGSPFGSFGAAAYSQAGFTAIMQLAAVAGLYGIPFVIGWFASVVNYAWEAEFSSVEIKRRAVAFAGVMLALFAFGFSRPVVADAPVQTVPVGGFSLPRERMLSVFGTIVDGNDKAVREAVSVIHDEQLAQIRKMAQDGAKIVTLQEGAGIGYKAEVDKMLAGAAEIAKDEGIYIVLPTATLDEAGVEPMHNVVHIIDPTGAMVAEHYKYGGTQFEGSVAGSGELQVVETPYGKISAIICWDADFPEVVKQAGEQEVDLLFIPSNDWYEIRDLHSGMATFRAVENGMPIFRQTGGGVSLVTDAYGRTVERIDMFETEQTGDWAAEQIVDVQIGSVNTLYPSVGGNFGLAMLVIMIGLLILAWTARRKAQA